MINSALLNGWMYLYCAAALVFIGLYCILMRRNMLRLLIGLEIVSKGICLLIISGGYPHRLFLAQALVITVIVIEVCVMAIGLSLVIRAYEQSESIDIRTFSNLKG
ncbi:MAG: NADH-quinone oxidoreductase subunit K [Candidatus Omnitrophica bacterium]|nr:NADH-quinone oxidoreductase subunit K [Candidatus Omnitrophota bacterium]MCM8829012.1 NADH-quinone oxidoreductase subunit K [Candidatus Omnitrophota bacterium]